MRAEAMAHGPIRAQECTDGSGRDLIRIYIYRYIDIYIYI